MPVTFLIAEGGGQKAKIRFDEAVIVIGRGASCHLRLPHPSVSDVHATVRGDLVGVSLTDEGSRNGTWVNGVRLAAGAPRVLGSGDTIRVGGVWLEVQLDVPEDANISRTTREIALAAVARSLEAPRAPTAWIVEGPDTGERLELAEVGRSYSLGRSRNCDLPLSDLEASREHARLTRRGDDVLVTDVGARNGVLLGDERIAPNSTRAWHPAVAMRVGGTVLTLRTPLGAEAAAAEVVAALPASASAPAPLSPLDAPPPASAAPTSLLGNYGDNVVIPESSGPRGPIAFTDFAAEPAAAPPPPQVAAAPAAAPPRLGVVLVAVAIAVATLAGLWVILR